MNYQTVTTTIACLPFVLLLAVVAMSLIKKGIDKEE